MHFPRSRMCRLVGCDDGDVPLTAGYSCSYAESRRVEWQFHSERQWNPAGNTAMGVALMKDLMAHLKAYDWGGDRGLLCPIDEQIKAAQGDAGGLAKIEQALLEVLDADVKVAAVDYICRQLALVGTRRAVPALVRLLQDDGLYDRALYALEAIPEESAGEALRTALPLAGGNLRVGIVNSLGERGDKKAVPALNALRGSSDTTLSSAVESALRKIGP